MDTQNKAKEKKPHRVGKVFDVLGEWIIFAVLEFVSELVKWLWLVLSLWFSSFLSPYFCVISISLLSFKVYTYISFYLWLEFPFLSILPWWFHIISIFILFFLFIKIKVMDHSWFHLFNFSPHLTSVLCCLNSLKFMSDSSKVIYF